MVIASIVLVGGSPESPIRMCDEQREMDDLPPAVAEEAKKHQLKQWCTSVVYNRYFDNFILVLICASH